MFESILKKKWGDEVGTPDTWLWNVNRNCHNRSFHTKK